MKLKLCMASFLECEVFQQLISYLFHQGIKFKRIGAPQPEDIIKASAEDAKR